MLLSKHFICFTLLTRIVTCLAVVTSTTPFLQCLCITDKDCSFIVRPPAFTGPRIVSQKLFCAFLCNYLVEDAFARFPTLLIWFNSHKKREWHAPLENFLKSRVGP